jgi:hypothetical protein
MLLELRQGGDIKMRRLWAVCAGFLIVYLVLGVAASAEDGKADSTSSPGQVYGYGIKLSRPYEFTESEDGRTLCLNGLIYAGSDDNETAEVTVTEEARAEYEVSIRAGEESRKGKTYDERMARLAAAYISSPLVEAVRKHGQCVYIRWASDPENEYVIDMPSEEDGPEFDRTVFWEQLMSSFWHTVNSDGMVAFGKKYHVFVPANLVPKTVEQIELVRRGTPRERLDVVETAVRNRRFLDDLYRVSQGVEGE